MSSFRKPSSSSAMVRGIVLIRGSIAIIFAAFSMARKLMTDKTLRLKRQAGRE